MERAYSFAVIYGLRNFYRLPCFPCEKGNAKGQLYAVVRYSAYGARKRLLPLYDRVCAKAYRSELKP